MLKLFLIVLFFVIQAANVVRSQQLESYTVRLDTTYQTVLKKKPKVCRGWALFGGINPSAVFDKRSPSLCTKIETCEAALMKRGTSWYKTFIPQFVEELYLQDAVKEAKKRGYTARHCFDYLVSVFEGKNFSEKSAVLKTTESLLNKKFNKLEKAKRIAIQLKLREYGFYKAEVDGIYGKNTVAGLNAFNSEYLANQKLQDAESIEILFDNLLASSGKNQKNRCASQSASNYDCELNLQMAMEGRKSESLNKVTKLKRNQISIQQVKIAFDNKDYSNGFSLAQALAVEGNADAQFYLGKMYEEGLGALQVSTLAHMWFNISALNGNEEAPERRKAIQQSMTPAAVEKAQTMALSCIQSRYVDCGAVMPMAPKVEAQQVQKPIRVEPTSSELRAYFVSQSLTERKQIQYALKQLGYYGSSVDGLWGKGTNRALVNYVSNERDITLPSAIYPSLIAKVEVPSRFATVKKKVVQQKPVSTANLSRDGKKCVSNGFSPGTQEYLQCLSYEQQRRQNQSNMLLNLGQGLLQTPSFPAPSTGGLSGGVFCNTMGNYTYCN